MQEYRFPQICPADLPVILASASPRRKDLLTKMGLVFTVLVSDADETLPPNVTPVEAVELLAARKVLAAAKAAPANAILLSADTLVARDGVPLGKPVDEADAHAMLRRLAGGSHFVHTGVAVFYRGKVYHAAETTEVVMRGYDEKEICDYVATGEPMDKAGAYGIQGLGGRLVERTVGAFDNVVGLPTQLADTLLCRALTETTGEQANAEDRV